MCFLRSLRERVTSFGSIMAVKGRSCSRPLTTSIDFYWSNASTGLLVDGLLIHWSTASLLVFWSTLSSSLLVGHLNWSIGRLPLLVYWSTTSIGLSPSVFLSTASILAYWSTTSIGSLVDCLFSIGPLVD